MPRLESAKMVALLGLLLLAAAGALGCVIGTPWQLLDNRRQTLRQTPANSFAWEAAHLVAAPKAAIVPRENDGDHNARDRAEQAGLSPAQQQALAAMRATPTRAAALAQAHDLPIAIRLYTAGAVAFAHDDMAGARAQFRAVLALPASDARDRIVWAAYMLGRTLARTGDPAGAARAFAQTRALAEAGAPDPLGLAAASLGEQARLAWAAGDHPAAIALYAQQAAAGSASAVQSLRIEALRLLTDPNHLGADLRDPLTARLLVITALARTGEYLRTRPGDLTDAELAGADTGDTPNLSPLHALASAIAAEGAPAGTDRLAALCYRLGDYETAARLAARTQTPLALWVRAKLALQRGDRAEAQLDYAQAIGALANTPQLPSLEPSSRDLLQGESGALTLMRGDFPHAMQVLWPVAATYWGDVAYLAERVLTTDELRAFVDAHVPPRPGLVKYTEAWQIDPIRIRNLLGRRLMRDGRYAEAIPYFSMAAPDGSDLRPAARALGDDLARAQSAFWAGDRASAGWRAALRLRERGMELTGTETEPDEAALDGAYPSGYGPPSGSLFKQPGTFVAAEPALYRASAPVPDRRYHYRFAAVELVRAAAAEIPARSQAYAAMLCRAARWMAQTPDAGADVKSLWRQYVAHGAAVPFAPTFGRVCPDPDFSRLRRTRQRLVQIALRDTIHRHKPLVLGSFGVLLLAGGWLATRAARR